MLFQVHVVHNLTIMRGLVFGPRSATFLYVLYKLVPLTFMQIFLMEMIC
jgi:hypothetical protein